VKFFYALEHYPMKEKFSTSSAKINTKEIHIDARRHHPILYYFKY